jgi:transposase InsO family protein
VPFATAALGRLSALSAWWIKLGITPELIEPSSPQQNGQHERMHRTLKAEATKPGARLARRPAAALRRLPAEYNGERPHEALGNDTPGDHYAPSPRPYPRGWRTPSTRGTLRCAT